MDRQPVASSNIRSIGYNSSDQVLEIEFNDGSVYHYFGVPQFEYQGLMTASSHGTYLAKNIKNKYTYKKIS